MCAFTQDSIGKLLPSPLDDGRDVKFGGLGAALKVTLVREELGNFVSDYPVTAADLSKVSNDRSREALIVILEKAANNGLGSLDAAGANGATPQRKAMYTNLQDLIVAMKQDLSGGTVAEHSPEAQAAQGNS